MAIRDPRHPRRLPPGNVLAKLVWILPMAAWIGIGGCGGPKVESRWLDRKVSIDGGAGEWEGALYDLDGTRLLVGVMNDGTDLYLCLGTEDRGLRRQVLLQGLTLWIDPDGGTKKAFGIHFPLGIRPADTFAGRWRGRGHGGEAAGDSVPGPADSTGAGADTVREKGRWGAGTRPGETVPDSTAQLEILPGELPGTRMSVVDAEGIALRLGLKDEAFVYELRIPLSRDDAHPYAVGAPAGKTIGLGLETPKMSLPGFRRERGGEGTEGPPGGGSPGGGRGGGRGGWRGGHGGGAWGGGEGGWRGGGRGGMQRGPAEPLNVWMKVKLAAGA